MWKDNLVFYKSKSYLIFLDKILRLQISTTLYDYILTEKVSEYDQEIPESQTANNPMAPRGRAT